MPGYRFFIQNQLNQEADSFDARFRLTMSHIDWRREMALSCRWLETGRVLE